MFTFILISLFAMVSIIVGEFLFLVIREIKEIEDKEKKDEEIEKMFD